MFGLKERDVERKVGRDEQQEAGVGIINREKSALRGRERRQYVVGAAQILVEKPTVINLVTNPNIISSKFSKHTSSTSSLSLCFLLGVVGIFPFSFYVELGGWVKFQHRERLFQRVFVCGFCPVFADLA